MTILFTFLGFVLLFFSFLILGRAEKDLAQFEIVQADNLQRILKSNPNQDGEIVLVSGVLTSKSKVIYDSMFDITIEGLKVYRKSYTYLWTENRFENKKPWLLTGENESQRAEYYKEWIADDFKWTTSSRKSNNSKRFIIKEGHENPSATSFNFLFEHPEGLKIDDFLLGKQLYEAIEDFSPVWLNDYHLPNDHVFQIDRISETKCFRFKMNLDTGEYIGEKQKERMSNSIFIGKGTPENPQIGDRRIEYWRVEHKPYTVLGRKDGDKIMAIKNESGMLSSKSTCGETRLLKGYFGMIYPGNLSKNQIFEKARLEYTDHNNTWRFTGYFMMVIGLLLTVHLQVSILNSIIDFSEITRAKLSNLFGFAAFFIPLVISVIFFLKYNRISHLSMKDYYFLVVLSINLLAGWWCLKTLPSRSK